jgi:hypothetical protein
MGYGRSPSYQAPLRCSDDVSDIGASDTEFMPDDVPRAWKQFSKREKVVKQCLGRASSHARSVSTFMGRHMSPHSVAATSQHIFLEDEEAASSKLQLKTSSATASGARDQPGSSTGCVLCGASLSLMVGAVYFLSMMLLCAMPDLNRAVRRH